MNIYLAIAITALLGICLGIWISQIMVEKRIERADISNYNKRFLKDVLGIPQD